MSTLSAIWNEVLRCDHCLRDSDIGPQLRDLPFFLPLLSNVEEPPYTDLIVAIELSANWFRTEAETARTISKHRGVVLVQNEIDGAGLPLVNLLCE